MPAALVFLGRVKRKVLQYGIPIDASSCPCPNVEVIVPPPADEESNGRGERQTVSAGSCHSLNKLTSDDIEIRIYLERIFSIFCRTLKKLELSASLHVLLTRPELSRILNKEDFKLVTDAFHQYTYVEPCTWPCSESSETAESKERNSTSIGSSTNLSDFNPKVHQAIEILNSYTEVREIVKQLRPEYSEQAQLFSGYIKYFIEHSLKRMHMSPIESREKDLYYRQLWRDNEKAKMDLRTLTGALDEQRRLHDTEIKLINMQSEKDLATVKKINKKCNEDIKHAIVKIEREMMMMYRASEIKQKEIRDDVIHAESHLKTIRALNIALEKDARDKRFKIQSQLLGVINKYDTEIGEQQKQLELLVAEFEEDKKRKRDLEAEIENQVEMYDALMKEREEASQAIINEKLAKLMMLRVAKIIQRWWRKIRERRRANIVKKKQAQAKSKRRK